MNGLVSLCHFCEQHGPSVIFCTQAFHVDPELLPAHQFQQSPSPKVSLPSLPSLHSLSSSTSTPSISSILSHFPVFTHLGEREDHSVHKQQTSCPACSSVGENERGYITYDNDAKTMYIGSRNPVDQQLYSVVRQACVRRCPFFLTFFFFLLLPTFSFFLHLQTTKLTGSWVVVLDVCVV